MKRYASMLQVWLLNYRFLMYLDCDPEVALKRIQLRGRSMGRAMDREYLSFLRAHYLAFLQSMEDAGVCVLRLVWNNPSPISEIARKICEMGLKTASFTRRLAPAYAGY